MSSSKNASNLTPVAIALAILSTTLISCSSDDDSAATSGAVAFDSLWLRDCQADNTSSFKDIVSIDGASSERIRESYGDSDCQVLSTSTSYDVIVAYGESAVDIVSGLTTYPVDLTVGEARITPATVEVADAYNDRELCGVTTYVASQTTVVSVDCEVFNFGAPVLFGLWATDDDLLYFGSNPTDSSVVDERPTTLDFAFPFRRQ